MNHPRSPCSKCPYRRDAPLGLWSSEEYLKVLEAETDVVGKIFSCHGHFKKPPAERGFCAGWLLDQKNRGMPSIALRLRISKDPLALKAFKIVTARVPMFASAAGMAIANIREIIKRGWQ